MKKFALAGWLALVAATLAQSAEFSITVPKEATLALGSKSAHYVDFALETPVGTATEGELTTYTFDLNTGKVYNYRASLAGGLTHAGYFTMNADPAKCPVINLTKADFTAKDPKAVNHDVKSNGGYETGDIFVNINPQGYLRLTKGDTFDAHAMRTWELTDNSVNNYFIEPDFHYTVVDLQGCPSTAVVEIEQPAGSAWAKLKAVGEGEAIVMVTYDGICVNYFSGADKKEYLGGEYWGAIWPENTAVYVVSVGGTESTVAPNMTINPGANNPANKLAGDNVDAEHDVFYYLDTTDGCPYTFKPENAEKVEVAYPSISPSGVAFSGFTTQGVTAGSDGAYTVLLRQGRQIVRLTDAAGNSTYQVLTARPCHREVSNGSREGSAIFQPGDKIKVAYSGLFHPANKLAGVYNMSAYVTYNQIPNGTQLIQTANQYTFGSSETAQTISIEIPADFNTEDNAHFSVKDGVIQVNGFGDPIGNHRSIDPEKGRLPNFNAVAHKTYFGVLPEVSVNVTPVRNFEIELQGIPADATVSFSYNGKELQPDDKGLYSGTYGSYDLAVSAEGFKCFRGNFNIGDDAPDHVVFTADLSPLGNAWDGHTVTEPQKDDNGVYRISTGAELAWLASDINTNGGDHNAVLVNDIELGNFPWTPIGTSSKSFTSTFEGNGHTVSELYIAEKANHKGLFGYINGAQISGVSIEGSVSGKQYVGGLAGYAAGASRIERCANNATVAGTGTYVGGLIGYLYAATGVITDCYNTGNVSGTTNCGGIAGSNNAAATITNVFSVGNVSGTTVGACIGGTTAKNNVSNVFSTKAYGITAGQTQVSEAQMASGEIAYILGEAFGQTIGEDSHPVFDGRKVFFDPEESLYYNEAEGFRIEVAAGEGVEVTHEGLVMKEDAECVLELVATPEGARLPEISWSSSDPAVADVTAYGVLTAVAEGEAIVSATALINDEDVSSSIRVRVEARPEEPKEDPDGIFAVGEDVTVDIYDINSRIVKLGASESDAKALPKGVYVFRHRNASGELRIK